MGFPVHSVVKNPPGLQGMWIQSLGQKIPWRRKWQPTQVVLSGDSHGQRSLVGYSPWAAKSDSSDWATKKQVIYDFWWYRFSNSFAYWVSFLGLPYKYSKLSGLNNRTIASRFWRLDDQGVSRIICPPKTVERDLLQIFLLAPDNSLDHRRNLHMVSSLCGGLCVQIPSFHKNTSHNGLGIHPAPGGPHLNCYSAKLYF